MRRRQRKGLINHAGGEVIKGGERGGGERGRLVFALCSFKTFIRVAIEKYTFNSSVLGGAPGEGGRRRGKGRGGEIATFCRAISVIFAGAVR